MSWALLYARFANQQLCDEPGHMAAVYHFAQGKPGWPEMMPMMPGYHYTVVAVGRGNPTPTTGRLVSALFGLTAVAAFAAAWRRLHGEAGGLAALVFALLPILQPFMGMAYSDAAGVAVLLWAAWAQIAGNRFLAAVLFSLACLTRQTNLIWIAFFVMWEASHAFGPGFFSNLPAVILQTWRRTFWLLLVIAVAIGTVLHAGRFTPGTGHGNSLRPNMATLHFAAWLFIGLALPLLLRAVWTAVLRHKRGRRPEGAGHDERDSRGRPEVDAARETRQGARTSRVRRVALIALSVAAALGFGSTYTNPHIWNQVLGWPEVSFTLLRNWPLVWMDNHASLRYLSGAGIVASAWILTCVIRRQAHRDALWLILLFSAILLGTNFLVEPRYFITPAAMLLLFLRLNPRDYAGLAAWFFFVNICHAPFILTGRSLW